MPGTKIRATQPSWAAENDVLSQSKNEPKLAENGQNSGGQNWSGKPITHERNRRGRAIREPCAVRRVYPLFFLHFQKKRWFFSNFRPNKLVELGRFTADRTETFRPAPVIHQLQGAPISESAVAKQTEHDVFQYKKREKQDKSPKIENRVLTFGHGREQATGGGKRGNRGGRGKRGTGVVEKSAWRQQGQGWWRLKSTELVTPNPTRCGGGASGERFTGRTGRGSQEQTDGKMGWFITERAEEGKRAFSKSQRAHARYVTVKSQDSSNTGSR